MKSFIFIVCVLSCGIVHAGCPGGICSLKRPETYSQSYAVSIEEPVVVPSEVQFVPNEVQSIDCCSTCDKVPVKSCSTCVAKKSVKSRRCRRCR